MILTLSHLLSLLAAACASSETTSALEPLVSKHFTYPNLPEQVTGDQGGLRGPQSGYNICNSTTENQQSQCQTLIVNTLDDFCMWSSNMQGSTDTISEGEAREVAWCTKPGHGTRLIPAGALTGIQLLYAKNYIQIVGFIDQTMVNLAPTDPGGELDPHGDDGQGNPLGGVVFSTGFGDSASNYAKSLASNSTSSSSYTQVIEWVDFIGFGRFCIKICNPDDPQAPHLCEHIYDVIGCDYNAPADYGNINGTFQACDSEDMTPPGVYTVNGATLTWVQPTVGPVIPPYTPTIPASSNCQTFSSEQLFGTPSSSPLPTTSSGASSATTSAGGSPTSGSVSGSRSGSSSSPSNTAGAGIATRVTVGDAPAILALCITLLTMFTFLAN